MIALYDHSFEGFLTAVFEAFEYRWDFCDIQKEGLSNSSLFDEQKRILNDPYKAERLWIGIQKYGGKKGQNLVYRVFLSELKGTEQLLLQFIQKLVKTNGDILNNPSEPTMQEMLKINRMVGREKHRMDAFVRFRETKDGFYFATIEPDFNVLPLNIPHFKKRYADQRWIIYDVKRDYGFFYDLEKVEWITWVNKKAISTNAKLVFSERERWFEELWKTYFRKTNINSRKNSKLHIKHIPKRYWKYLPEKEPI